MKKTRRIKHDSHGGSEHTLNALSTEERIRQRAYKIHQARGGVHGRDLDDWLQAEREIKAEVEIKTKMGQLPEEDPAGLEISSLPKS